MNAFELPVVAARPTATPASAAAPPISRERYAELAARARLLSWLSMAVITAEAVVGIVAGLIAGSIALVAFGLDSVIEGLASGIIIWRFTGARTFSQDAETRAQRLVAAQFFLLGPYVAFESVRALAGGEHPDTSYLGIGLAFVSAITMPLLGYAKQKIAVEIGSSATAGEGRQNMLCAYLAGALLIGLLSNALVGAWWLDPLVGLTVAFVAVREGVDSWKGESCCTSSPLESFNAGSYKDDSCA